MARVKVRGLNAIDRRTAAGRALVAWRGEEGAAHARAHRSLGRSRRRYSRSWARLIARVYQVDPLVRSCCGNKMALLAFVTDGLAIRRIHDYFGLSPPEEKASAPLCEVRQVPLDEEGRKAIAP